MATAARAGSAFRGPIRSYRDLEVWVRSVDLVEEVHQVTACFPRSETYGLASQLRRAAVSVASNIAEGHARDALGDYLHHLSIAKGSLAELETQVLISERLAYLPSPKARRLLLVTSQVGRMLTSLGKALRRRRHQRKSESGPPETQHPETQKPST